jgi:hypothetical protein
MLALVALGERAFMRVEMDVIAPWHWDWRLTGKAAKAKAAKAEVLCFGDSAMKFAVLPPVLEGRTGHSAYNFAVAMGQAPSSYFLLRRALRAGARPRAVLIDAVPILLSEGPREPRHLRQWPDLLTPAELLDLAWTARDPGLLVAVAAAELLPSLRAREEARAAVLERLRGEPPRRRFLAAQFQRNARVNRGANVMLPNPLGDDFAGSVRYLFGRFACDPVNAAYVDRFLALAAGRGIPVFWVIPPVLNEAQRACDASGFGASETAFVRALQERYPNLHVLDGRRGDYGRDLYSSDPIHLSRDGATVFSDDLAAYLARALRGERLPRWVTLPAYRARPTGVAVEDIGGSAMALTRRGTDRR